MSWETYTLDQLGEISRGRSRHRPRDAEFLYGGPYPFVQTGDVKAAPLYLSQYTQTYSEEGLKQSKLWPKGTLCITIAANIAETSILDMEACFPDSIIGFVADPEKADTKFVKYQFDALLRSKMKKVSQGAAQDNLSQAKLLTFEFPTPDLPTQKRIAGVLSAYDDLIENNRRRIALLEEAARLIYREWFVHFRFPNHENTKFENGLPAGWELTELGSCTDLTWGDTKTTKSSYVEHGFDAFSAAGLDGKLEKFDFDRDGIVLSAIGANCGKTWLAKGKWSCIKNTIRIFPEHPNLSTEYLYFATLGEAAWVKRGAAQPFISQGDARSRKIIVPTHGVSKEFEKHAFPLFRQSNELRIQNQALTKARDLLLPRLMDGRIAV